MARDYLGLFDTPPNRQEIRFGVAIVGLLFAAVMVILPIRNIQLGSVDAFVPTINAVMFAGELIIGTLLYAQAAVFRSRALTILASGYIFAALLLVPHALSFPGAFSDKGLLGAKVNTTAWLAIFRRLAFPAAVILYAWLKRADSQVQPDAERPPPMVGLGLIVAIALAALVTLLTTLGHDLLPPLFLNQREGIHTNLLVFNSTTIALSIAAMVMLFRQDKSVLDMWLLVALSGWLFQSLLNLPLHARFTLGWYGLFVIMLASNLFVMLALIAESNRLYARLALSTAARDRERDARLMSMDAVAAAIAHEVGQPLTAVKLSASAALRWLTRSEPDTARAIQSLRETIDSGERTFDIIKSIRATFAQGSGPVSEFSLNDLVRETASLMDRELAARKVSLQLSLDEGLPPILANRVQIQRVLINLLTNAIESMVATRGRQRLLAIRSVLMDGQKAQLDVSDSGTGISLEKMAQIFEPFFTTKATGTGLGLSLSRSIIEDHGGRLWASAGEDLGATFHMQLNCRPGIG